MRSRAFMLFGLWLAAARVWSVEPWTDPRLTVTNRLSLWLDVTRQNAARGSYGQSPLRSWNDRADFVFDGSGYRRHFSQALLDARPAFYQWQTAALRFDGTNDFLELVSPDWRTREATVFAVVNPQRVGSFTGVFGAAERGRNDYQTGLNLDFGGTPTTNLTRINAEGAGFVGEADLWGRHGLPLNTWHSLGIVVGAGSQGVKLFLDGQPAGSRARAEDTELRFESMTLGARRYSNSAERPFVQGFFAGEFTELLVFDRVLPDAERVAVERYLNEKYGVLLRGLAGAPIREGAVPLVAVTNPPPVQIHFPGFAARELPVDLSNINNVRYRADGTLVAVGYDGRVWLLRDTDGDGLEDKAEPFWDQQTIRAPIGAALTPPGYPRGDGLFIAAKDRLVLLVDTNRDDRADAEITVATWSERSEQQGVDALGVAVGPDQSVYFSLGAASFTEPFLIDKATGQARYRTTMERGTIQRVSPDFSKRETVATGIRFAIGLAFNQRGDLFCTDQEGATWRHDGNPFDELLEIKAGRHYGFPPRHPRYLPDVIDEPSVFDYGPQHQSTCGLCFNVPAPTAFGPARWQGDALVAGYTRGKLWRTQLTKTTVGYVARTDLLATLQSLVVDVCVSPRGDLVVASHSGLPDWGSGPTGKGHLFQVRYQDRTVPQPVAAWNASPTELSVAFDRPLDAGGLKGLAERARIESGEFVFPADRFETIRPGYQVVYDQVAAPRFAHEILGSRLSEDRRTLTLLTKPREIALNYAVTLPGDQPPGSPGPVSVPVETKGSRSETDLLTTLNGIEARWVSADGQDSWSGWLPHLDLQVVGEFTAGSAEHERFFQLIARPGTLVLRGQLDLWQMLQPAIQPGAAIDWERPAESVRIRVDSSADFHWSGKSPTSQVVDAASSPKSFRAESEFKAPGMRWHPFEITVRTGLPNPTLTPAWSEADDPDRWRPFPVRRFFVPWARRKEAGPASTADRNIPELAGGRWLRGRQLFFSEKLACAQCHTLRGEGAKFGPDLSNLVHRDYSSVRQDIEFPNAAINPDHVGTEIELQDGQMVNGVLQREQDGLVFVALVGGKEEKLARSDVKSQTSSARSLMPDGIWAALSADEQRDLMTFLFTSPLEPAEVAAEIQGQNMPPARKRTEVIAALGATERATENRPDPALRIVLCASEKDAGHRAPGFHDYPLWRERWAKLFALAEGVIVETADRWPSAEQWQRADVIAFYHDNPAWVAEKARDIDAFLARGGGLLFLHWSINAYRDVDSLKQRLAFAWGPGAKFRYGMEELSFVTHDLTAGFPATSQFTDEAYWKLPGDGLGAIVLATSVEEGQATPQIWLKESGGGRVFVCIPGHFTWTFDDPLYRVLLLRGFAWAGRQPLGRFNELVFIGARVRDE